MEMKVLFFLLILFPVILYAIDIDEILVNHDSIPISQENAGIASEINAEKLTEPKADEMSIETFKGQSVSFANFFLYSSSVVLN